MQTLKITVQNGVNLVSFTVKTEKTLVELGVVNSANLLSNEIICELQNLNDTNNELKKLGYKGNFFKFTLGRKCILSIEATNETENFTFIKNLEFSFGKLDKLSNPETGLNVILRGVIMTNRNNVQIC